VALVAGDAVLGADGGEGAADGEARHQEVAMGIGGGMEKEESAETYREPMLARWVAKL